MAVVPNLLRAGVKLFCIVILLFHEEIQSSIARCQVGVVGPQLRDLVISVPRLLCCNLMSVLRIFMLLGHLCEGAEINKVRDMLSPGEI